MRQRIEDVPAWAARLGLVHSFINSKWSPNGDVSVWLPREWALKPIEHPALPLNYKDHVIDAMLELGGLKLLERLVKVSLEPLVAPRVILVAHVKPGFNTDELISAAHAIVLARALG